MVETRTRKEVEFVDFNYIIFLAIKETAEARIKGDLIGFQNGVETIELLMTPYQDDEYFQAINVDPMELEKLKKIDETKWKIKLFEIQTNKFKALMNLCARSGFLPEFIVEGVLDEKIVEELTTEPGPGV